MQQVLHQIYLDQNLNYQFLKLVTPTLYKHLYFGAHSECRNKYLNKRPQHIMGYSLKHKQENKQVYNK